MAVKLVQREDEIIIQIIVRTNLRKIQNVLKNRQYLNLLT